MASHSAKEKIATQLNDFQFPTNFPCKNLREHLISFLSLVFKNPTSKAVKSLTRWGHSIFFNARRQIKEMPSSFWAKFRPNYFFRFFQSLQLEDAAVHSIQTTVYPRKLYEKAKMWKQIWDKNGLSNTLAITAFPESAEYLQKTDIFSENLPTFAWCSFTNMTCTLHLSVFSWFMFLSNFTKNKMKIRKYFPKILCPWIMDCYVS